MKTEVHELVKVEITAANMARSVQGALRYKGADLERFKTLTGYISYCIQEQTRRDWPAATLAMEEQQAAMVKARRAAMEPYPLDACHTVASSATTPEHP